MDLVDVTTTIRTLLEVFAESDIFDRLKAILAEYSVMNRGDWSKYAFFNDGHYVRNLIDGDDRFELMVICWGPGQKSRVHDHEKSRCVFTVIQGRIDESLYDFDLKHQRDDVLEEGHVSHVENSQLHSVGNSTSTPSVTLHLYFPPIKRVKLFDLETKEVTERTPGFYSVKGHRV